MSLDQDAAGIGRIDYLLGAWILPYGPPLVRLQVVSWGPLNPCLLLFRFFFEEKQPAQE
jgi:hypothetical protein